MTLPAENPARQRLLQLRPLIVEHLHVACAEELSFVATVVGAHGRRHLRLATLLMPCAAARWDASTQWIPQTPPPASLPFRLVAHLMNWLLGCLPSIVLQAGYWLSAQPSWHVLLAAVLFVLVHRSI
eukprot:5459096-Prymnesium_polylepis.1